MVKFLAPALAVALAGLGLTCPASAKFYVFGTGMWVNAEDSDVDNLGLSGTLETDTGWGIAGGIGYIIGPKLRSEIEISYRKNDADRVTIASFGVPAGTTSGDQTVMAGMINAIYDIVTWGGFTPYVGVGAGVAHINVDISSGGVNGNSGDTDFAYQGMVGVRYAVTQAIDVKLGYRFFALLDPQFGTTSSDYHTHNVEMGVAFKF